MIILTYSLYQTNSYITEIQVSISDMTHFAIIIIIDSE